MPWKTILTVATFTAAMLCLRLRDPQLFDFQSVPLVWQMPVPKPPPIPVEQVKIHRQIKIEVAPGAEAAARQPLDLGASTSDAYSFLFDPTHELDPFFTALNSGQAVVLHYGDSPTTADLITADARALLQKQFGDAGSGFVLIARPWAWYGHRGVDMDASNWKIDVAGSTEIKDGLHGLGAASFRGQTGAVAHWKLKDPTHTRVEIAYLKQPGGGSFTLEASGDNGTEQLGSADTDGEQSPGFASFVIPPGSKEFTLRVTRGPVRLYGADFRKSGPGVVYSSLGINGANITLLSKALNGAQWAAELKHYKPNLVVVAFGTNESGYPKFVDGTWGPELKAAVRRIRAALPDSAILLMSPMDRGERKDSGEIGTIEALPRLVDIESKAAADLGVAFFNTFEAMGGAGTMARWYNGEPRLVGADFIHPMPSGARIVGELLYDALRDGYKEYKLRELKKLELATEGQPATARSESSN